MLVAVSLVSSVGRRLTDLRLWISRQTASDRFAESYRPPEVT